MKTILVANRKGGCGKTMTAITIAAALAQTGGRTAIADADPQKSALRWLKMRPVTVPAIVGVDWTKSGKVGDVPKHLDWLVIDAPGAIREGRAEALIAEAKAVISPVLPSFFDEDSTRRFLGDIEDIKRVRKGKVGIHMIANRVRPNQKSTARLKSFFDEIGQVPLAWISERTAYADLAEDGLAVFDKPLSSNRAMRNQWAPVVDAITAH
ncbi:ParA family protein [Amaricoccus macauensis]|uniref:ParA family protein n=1 Tax=Amaricoccus macauensis TaxID=57001 RepID=UPI003C7B9D04